jgi:secreted trypsin-like serine protease
MGGRKRAVRISGRLAPIACALLLAGIVTSPASAATTAQTSIVNGAPAPITAFPSLAFVQHKAPSLIRRGGPPEYESCSGTVVAPRIVLTAGHCVQSFRGGLRSSSGFRVTTGVANGTEAIRAGNESVVSRVSRVLIIPGYNPKILRYDVGLLILAKPVSAPPIQLAKPSEAGLAAPGTALTIAGWGYSRKPPAEISPLLRSGVTTIDNNPSCQQNQAGAPRGFFPEFQLCAFATPQYKTISCKGDSGGPGIVTKRDGTPVEVGVISSQAGNCAVDEPEVLTRVDAVYGWIAEWIAAIEKGQREPRVQIPKVKLPRMTERNAKAWAPGVLAWNFRKSFTKRRSGSFAVNQCTQTGREGIKCNVHWVYAGMRWSGHVSFHYGTTREGRIVNFGFRISHLNKTCLRKYRGTRRCVVIVRGH